MKSISFSIKIFYVLVMVLLAASCASFKGDIPIETDFSDAIYISPANRDGIQDSVTMNFQIPELKGLKVSGYSISVASENGTVVFSESAEVTDKKGLFSFLRKKESVKVPSRVVWGGTNQAGSFVPDGTYFLSVEAWDRKNNRGEIPPVRIIVDNTPPHAELSLPYNTFSPDNDNNQDVLYINQKNVSPEKEWKGFFSDSSGSTVRSYSWKGVAPDFEWDGLDNSGNSLPDGEYIYTLSSTDLAGNSSSFKIEKIVIDNRKFPVRAFAEDPWFSPNRDGIKDKVSISLYAESPGDIVEASGEIIDSSGRVVRNFPADGTLPVKIEFDGTGNNGRVLPEGFYYFRFTALYKNGEKPSAISNRLILDITKPQAVLSKSYSVFSPDGDGRRDEIEVFQSTSVEDEWSGTIYNSAGNAVRTFTWKERATAGKWDGRDSSGNIVPDGLYHYTLSSTDRAGNSASYTLTGIRVDTRPTPVKITSSKTAFSPNSDGIADQVEFMLKPQVTDGITGWIFSVRDSGGNDVYRKTGDSDTPVPETVPWDGRDSKGKISEGSYAGFLEVSYEKGNISSSMTENSIEVDLSPPEISVELSPLPFSPDDDGENDVLTIKVNLRDPAGIGSWSSRILDPSGNLFLNIPSSQFRNNAYSWNGKSSSGELVQSASDYKLVVRAEDNLGNAGTREFTIPIDILVIKEGDRYRISISSIYFKPFTADYISVEPELAAKNIETLDRLAKILQKFGNYNIKLEGHAVRVLWNQPDRWLTEENEVLMPLSKERANAVRDALIARGIAAGRMKTEGFGGYRPVVPHSDLQNRWKSRRVEFILER